MQEQIPAKSDQPDLGIRRDHAKTLLDGVAYSCDFFLRDARVDDVKERYWHWLLIRQDVLHR